MAETTTEPRTRRAPTEFIQEPIRKAKTYGTSRARTSTLRAKSRGPCPTKKVAGTRKSVLLIAATSSLASTFKDPTNIDPDLPPPITPQGLQEQPKVTPQKRARSEAIPSVEKTPRPGPSRGKKAAIPDLPPGSSDESRESVESDKEEVDETASDSYIWEPRTIREMLLSAQRQANCALQQGTGFKRKAWNRMVKDINILPNLNRTVNRRILQSKWQTIKNQ